MLPTIITRKWNGTPQNAASLDYTWICIILYLNCSLSISTYDIYINRVYQLMKQLVASENVVLSSLLIRIINRYTYNSLSCRFLHLKSKNINTINKKLITQKKKVKYIVHVSGFLCLMLKWHPSSPSKNING